MQKTVLLFNIGEEDGIGNVGGKGFIYYKKNYNG